MDPLTKAINGAVQKKDYSSISCKVTAYNETDKTCICEPLNGSAKFFKVKLNANNEDKFIFIPKLDSIVVVNYLDKGKSYISMFSEIEEVFIKSESIILNEGDNGGLINISDLVSRLNIIENDLNLLKKLFTAWVPAPTDGGASLKATVAPWYAQSLTPTKKADMEDDKIKH